MKKVLLAICVLGVVSLCSCHGLNVHFSRTKTSKAEAEELRQLTGFERIELMGSLDVRYMQADSFSVKVVAPPKVVDDVKTRVDGNKLVVYMKGQNNFINFGVSDSRDVTVYVTSPDFIGISLRGSGDFKCERLLDTDNLDVELSGSGDIEFDDIICDRINVSLVGSGDVEIQNVKMLESQVGLTGSGDIKMRFSDSGKVDANVTGSGDITLKGTVKELDYHVRGSGDIHTEGLKTINNKQ